jgi:hypothetical protein
MDNNIFPWNVPVRFHMLRDTDLSARHAFISLVSDGSGEESREMELGTAAHAILFNTDRVVAAPMKRDDRSAKYQAFERENAGALILTPTDYDKAHKLADAVRANPVAREMVEAREAIFEKTVILDWEGEPYSGRKCRMTPDLVIPNALIADFKTSKSAAPSKWPYLMRDYDIAGQLAWYSVAYPAAVDHFTVVVEKGTNIVQVYKVDEASMQKAWERNLERLAKLRQFEETGAWPAYSADEVLVVEQASAWPTPSVAA